MFERGYLKSNLPEKLVPGEPFPEKKEELSDIFWRFLSSPHGSENDLTKTGLKKEFKKSDIYVPEIVGYPSALQVFLQELSDGEITPGRLEQNLFYGFRGITLDESLRYQINLIYKSHKYILLADLPKDSEIEGLYETGNKHYNHALELFEAGKFGASLNEMRVAFTSFALYFSKREAHIKTGLEDGVKKLINEKSSLKKKKKINVLVGLGSGHTDIYHKFYQENPTAASRSFSSSPIVYTASSEAVRRSMFSKQIPDRLLAQTFIEHVLMSQIEEQKLTDDHEEVERVLREITNQLTPENIEKMSQLYKSGRLDDGRLLKYLRSIGVKIPRINGKIFVYRKSREDDDDE